MKRFAALVMAVSAFFAVSSCVKFDDSEIQSELTSIKSRLSALEDKVNTNISGLWEIVNAQKDGIIITSVTETDDSWILKFGNGKTATVSKGGTASAPVVGVKKSSAQPIRMHETTPSGIHRKTNAGAERIKRSARTTGLKNSARKPALALPDAASRKEANTSSVKRDKSTGPCWSVISPESIFARSSTSFTSSKSVVPLARMDSSASSRSVCVLRPS